jgi:predicted MFS family arabinose efflux permease
MYMVGSILQSFFTLGCGLARNANEIIIFRALSGVAIAFCLPSAVSIITSTLDGKRRNFAFASMGGGQPVGFSIGLTLGGVLTDSIGWRWGFYLAAILNTIVVAIALWGLPSSIDNAGLSEDEGPATWKQRWHRMETEIDWIGAIIASVSLAMLSYVFATIAGNRSSISQPSSIVLLTSAILLSPAFIYWVGRQEKLGRPAIIPNSLWRNRIFTTICVAVFFTWGSFNALETIMTFYFQDVQKYSATQTSIYFLPAPIAGVICNVAMGYLVHRVPANWLALIGCAVSLGAPLAMVNATPNSIYWSTCKCIGIFVMTGTADDGFCSVPRKHLQPHRRRLPVHHRKPAYHVCLPREDAGSGRWSLQHCVTGKSLVIGTLFLHTDRPQIGKSVGLGLVAVIAADITAKSKYEDKKSPEALLEGYKATWWFCLACIVFTVAVSIWGLRGIGRVGHKRD